MTQEEIIEMARQIQRNCEVSEDGYYIWSYEVLGSFAKLVAEKERERMTVVAMNAAEKAVDVAIKLEREACAKLCDKYNFGQAPMMIQQAIRARGEQA
jgi:hypothetical protein